MLLSKDFPDEAIIGAIDRWVALLETEQYEAAFQAIEYDEASGWTPELVHQVIAKYGDALPGQKATLAGKPTDITQRKSVQRFERNKAGFVGYVCYDLNINGIVSDLTATFGLRKSSDGLVLVLDDIHVM